MESSRNPHKGSVLLYKSGIRGSRLQGLPGICLFLPTFAGSSGRPAVIFRLSPVSAIRAAVDNLFLASGAEKAKLILVIS
jgi:hypothetical protein